MDQEKRLMLAFALSFGVLVLWRALMVKTPPPPPKPATTGLSHADVPAKSSHLPAALGRKEPAAKSEPPPPLHVVQGVDAADVVVENNLYRVIFSSQGAVVKSWVLKKYRDKKGEPLDVVDADACQQLGFPMSLVLDAPRTSLATQLNQAIYMVQALPSGGRVEITTSSPLTPPVRIAFVYSDGNVEARKEFIFGAGYEVQVKTQLRDGTQLLPVGVTWPGGFGDHSLPPAESAVRNSAFYQTPDSTSIHEVNLKPSFFGRFYGSSSQQNNVDVNGPVTFAGLEDRFFVGSFMPGSTDAAFQIIRKTWTPADWKGPATGKPDPLEATLTGPDSSALSFRLVVAPKDLEVLRSLQPPLDGLVNFGWFTIFAKPLFLALRFIYDHVVHNYGWAIIILTLVINFALFPFKVKSIRSAQRMQKVAPLVKSIQDRYKQYKFNDPRKARMNQEMMDLYKEHGVNPLGGCLPMGVQLPFLYAFWRVLDLAIELRHAPWILWIKDLSAPDNFHLGSFPLPILPILMVVTMFIQQKMTPMPTTDPAQQRMMMVMPIVFGVMFFGLASGLVLYYTAANIVGIAQQQIINHWMPIQSPAPTARKGPEKKAN